MFVGSLLSLIGVLTVQLRVYLMYIHRYSLFMALRATNSFLWFIVYYLQNTSTIFSSFRSIKDKVETLSVILMPTSFTCDFESGLISSVRTEFPTTHIRGSYFHFCQAIYRRVQLLGLSTIYIHHEGHRMYIRKLLAIEFIPVDLIPQTFDYLKQHCPPEQQSFLNIFRTIG